MAVILGNNAGNIATSGLNERFGFEVGNDYYFYDASKGKIPSLYQELLSSAQTRIDIWDPYFDLVSAKLFASIKQVVDINITTKYSGSDYTPWDAKRGKVNEFVDEIKNVLKQNGIDNPKIHMTCFFKNDRSYDWHDRYLVIDSREVYLVGTSITEQINPIKSFGIFRISKATDIELIKRKIDSCKNLCVTIDKNRKLINGYTRH